MLETKQPTRVSAALIFIRQYGYEDNFVLNQDISSLYANQLEGKKGRNLIQKRNFIGSVLKIRQQIELAQYLSYIKNGKEVKFDILYEIPHHYIIYGLIYIAKWLIIILSKLREVVVRLNTCFLKAKYQTNYPKEII